MLPAGHRQGALLDDHGDGGREAGLRDEVEEHALARQAVALQLHGPVHVVAAVLAALRVRDAHVEPAPERAGRVVADHPPERDQKPRVQAEVAVLAQLGVQAVALLGPHHLHDGGAAAQELDAGRPLAVVRGRVPPLQQVLAVEGEGALPAGGPQGGGGVADVQHVVAEGVARLAAAVAPDPRVPAALLLLLLATSSPLPPFFPTSLLRRALLLEVVR